jgi:hypothetical protein
VLSALKRKSMISKKLEKITFVDNLKMNQSIKLKKIEKIVTKISSKTLEDECLDCEILLMHLKNDFEIFSSRNLRNWKKL